MPRVTLRETPKDAGWLLTIDRYLLRRFIHSFLICFLSLTGLIVVIDGFGNADEFIEYGHRKGSVLAVVGEYYGFRMFWFFDLLGPMITLIAAMFTVTWLQRHNEMTALEAAGIAKSRIIQPLIAAAVAVALIAAGNREFVMPHLRGRLTHNAQNLGGSFGQPLRPRYDTETSIWLGGSGSKTFADQQRIEKPDFDLPAGLDQYGSQILAANAYYQSPTSGRPGGYLFKDVKVPKGLDKVPSLYLGKLPVLLTAHDTPWIEPNSCFVVSNVRFEQLERGGNWWQFCSTRELIQGLGDPSLDFGAGERLAIHARVVQPVLDMTLLFLGLPLILSRNHRNVFYAIGLCVALVICFMLIVLGCQYLGSGYWIEPALAAWLPLMIFVPCAVALSKPFRE